MPDNKDLPAYPNVEISETGETCTHSDYRGLSKRELIAAMCLQGLISGVGTHGISAYAQLAERATFAADALLIHLQNT